MGLSFESTSGRFCTGHCCEPGARPSGRLACCFRQHFGEGEVPSGSPRSCRLLWDGGPGHSGRLACCSPQHLGVHLGPQSLEGRGGHIPIGMLVPSVLSRPLLTEIVDGLDPSAAHSQILFRLTAPFCPIRPTRDAARGRLPLPSLMHILYAHLSSLGTH